MLSVINNFMQSDKSREISQGDLAIHSRGINVESGIVVEKVGLVLRVNPTLGSGFKSADVMWCESGNVETVMVNYLRPVNKL